MESAGGRRRGFGAEHGVGLHDLKFFGVEFARLEEDAVGDSDFSEVVQGRCLVEKADVFGVDAVYFLDARREGLGEKAGVALDALDVSTDFHVAAFGELSEGEERHVACFQGKDSLGVSKDDLHFLHIERLGEKGIGTGGESLAAALGTFASGEHDEIDITVEIVRADGAAKLQAVHFGHFPVGDDEAYSAVAEEVERFGRAAGADHGVAQLGEGAGENVEVEGVVIYGQDLHASPCRFLFDGGVGGSLFDEPDELGNIIGAAAGFGAKVGQAMREEFEVGAGGGLLHGKGEAAQFCGANVRGDGLEIVSDLCGLFGGLGPVSVKSSASLAARRRNFSRV